MSREQDILRIFMLVVIIILLFLLTIVSAHGESVPPTTTNPPSPALAFHSLRSPVKSGYAVYYDVGVMERIARFRNLPATSRLASNTDCWRIGQYVTAIVNGYRDTYRIVDCSDPTKRWQKYKRNGKIVRVWESDRDRHLREGLVIEVNGAARNAYFPKGAGRAKATVLYYSGVPCDLVGRKCRISR